MMNFISAPIPHISSMILTKHMNSEKSVIRADIALSRVMMEV